MVVEVDAPVEELTVSSAMLVCDITSEALESSFGRFVASDETAGRSPTLTVIFV